MEYVNKGVKEVALASSINRPKSKKAKVRLHLDWERQRQNNEYESHAVHVQWI